MTYFTPTHIYNLVLAFVLKLSALTTLFLLTKSENGGEREALLTGGFVRSVVV